jgi:hypothetical protein
MIQIKNDVLRNLDKINQEHCDLLKPEILLKTGRLKNRQAQFINTNIDALLKSKPADLFRLGKEYKDYCTSKGRGALKDYNKGLASVFDYKKFSTKSDTAYRSYTLAKKLRVNTCPYCNRNYTVTVERGKDQIVRPDFDHFFPKSQYPLFSLSFYNLIPSCLICNRSIKGQQKVVYGKYVHPYEEGFGDSLKINYKPLDSDSALGINDNYEIEIILDASEKSARCAKSFTLFRLKELYEESHNNEIADIIYKHHVSNGRYLENIKNMFPRLATIDELYKLAFGNYFDETHHSKRTLSKLTRDIVEQLIFVNPFAPVSPTP